MSGPRDLCIMACVFCRDVQFRAWLAADCATPATEAEAKDIILSMCGVTSRNDLDTDPIAALAFHKRIREPFMAWKAAEAEQGT